MEKNHKHVIPQKLLAVDDEKEVREFIKDYFEDLGFQVMIAGSGQEALEKELHFKPHLILMDVQMPGMSGVQALEILRERGCKARVIMVTACKEVQVIEKIIRLGADHYLLKPLSLEVMEKEVKEAFKSFPPEAS